MSNGVIGVYWLGISLSDWFDKCKGGGMSIDRRILKCIGCWYILWTSLPKNIRLWDMTYKRIKMWKCENQKKKKTENKNVWKLY